MPLQQAILSQIRTATQEVRIIPIAAKKAVAHQIQRDVIAFTTKKRIEMVRLADISYVQAEDNYSRIHLLNQLPVFLSKTLKELDRILEKEGFIRVHQSYLVHPAQILNYNFGTRELTLRDGIKIPVSRANSKRVTDDLLKWGERN
jgi:two-component system LytT family response regulator